MRTPRIGLWLPGAVPLRTRTWGQPQSQAPGTSLGLRPRHGPVCGPGSAGPMARKGRAVGSWRLPCSCFAVLALTASGPEIEAWAVGRIGGAVGRVLCHG